MESWDAELCRGGTIVQIFFLLGHATIVPDWVFIELLLTHYQVPSESQGLLLGSTEVAKSFKRLLIDGIKGSGFIPALLCAWRLWVSEGIYWDILYFCYKNAKVLFACQ